MRNSRVTRFKVQGKTRFPVDMLRHDACYPATPEAVTAISNSIDPQARRDTLTSGEPLTVELVTALDINHITEARWSSFGWHVTEKRRV